MRRITGDAPWSPRRRATTRQRPLPCPFCLSSREIEYQDALSTDAQGNDIACLVCEVCGCWGPWATGGRSRTIYFWNLRSKVPLNLAENKRIQAPVVDPEEDEAATGGNPCPFCGGTDLRARNCGLHGENAWVIGCQNCGGSGPQPEVREENTREQALREWNGSLRK